jgi:hypothetical protein
VRGFVVYTVLRLGLLIVAWFLVQLLTPMRGLVAVAVALVVSGVVGFFLLDRSRDQASVSVSKVFARIDERIEKSKTAEDDLLDALAAQREAKTQQDAVDDSGQAGQLQDPDEISSPGPIGDQEPRSRG